MGTYLWQNMVTAGARRCLASNWEPTPCHSRPSRDGNDKASRSELFTRPYSRAEARSESYSVRPLLLALSVACWAPLSSARAVAFLAFSASADIASSASGWRDNPVASRFRHANISESMQVRGALTRPPHPNSLGGPRILVYGSLIKYPTSSGIICACRLSWFAFAWRKLLRALGHPPLCERWPVCARCLPAPELVFYALRALRGLLIPLQSVSGFGTSPRAFGGGRELLAK